MKIISAWRGRGSPYTHFAHGIPDRPRGIFQQARYQIVPGSHGAPVAQVELHVARTVPGCPNPDGHAWGAHVIEFFAIGTAVEEISEDHVIEPPTLVLPLID